MAGVGAMFTGLRVAGAEDDGFRALDLGCASTRHSPTVGMQSANHNELLPAGGVG